MELDHLTTFQNKLRPQNVAPASSADGGDHLWAKSLFRLQCSLLYFFAAEYKMQPDWLGPRGGSLIKERGQLGILQHLENHLGSVAFFEVSKISFCLTFKFLFPLKRQGKTGG